MFRAVLILGVDQDVGVYGEHSHPALIVSYFAPLFDRRLEAPQVLGRRRLPVMIGGTGRVNSLHVFQPSAQHLGQADFLLGGNAFGGAVKLVG